MIKFNFSKVFQKSGNDLETTPGLLILIGFIKESGAKASAILWSSYVLIVTSLNDNLSDFKISIESLLTMHLAPSFDSSLLSAINLSVSFTFKVDKPVNFVGILSPQDVTIIVWAKSGLSFKLISIFLGLIKFFILKIIISFPSNLYPTPNCL